MLQTLYRAPSLERLKREMGLDDHQAKLVRKLLKGKLDLYNLPDEFEKTRDWLDRCYHAPKPIEVLLEALDETCETTGVETLGRLDPDTYRERPRFAYLNQGDSYMPTLVYSYSQDRFLFTSVGDLSERYGF